MPPRIRLEVLGRWHISFGKKLVITFIVSGLCLLCSTLSCVRMKENAERPDAACPNMWFSRRPSCPLKPG